jgi:importin subunit beta-1
MAGQVNITEILANCRNPDTNIRNQAEKMLQDMQQQNPPMYFKLLTGCLCNEGAVPQLRQLAGLQMKNALDAQDDDLADQRAKVWRQIDVGTRNGVKAGVVQSLASAEQTSRHTCAQVIAKIARIEFPAGEWNELIPGLLSNVTKEGSPPTLVQASLQSLGYFCEEIDSDDVQQSSVNEILTAIVDGMKPAKPPEIVHAACTAMLNALEFVHTNFGNKPERDHIMNAICAASTHAEQKVRVVAYECIGQVANLYYEHLGDYMQALFTMTFKTVREDHPDVGMQSLEFWSTVCDTEVALLEAEEEGEESEVKNARYVEGALQFLVPLLTETLTKQDEDQDDDTWNIAMAGGTCLSLAAQVAKDGIVAPIMPFITGNIQNPDWRHREAAMLAFGSIMEGPSEETLKPYVQQALPLLLHQMGADKNELVKDTTAWTLGRVCGLHTEAITAEMWPQLCQVLVTSMDDVPRVANNICFACHNLAQAMDDVCEDEATNPLSPYFKVMVEKLLATADRSDWDENNLRVAAYEAVNMMVSNAANDIRPLIKELVPYFCQKLDASLKKEIVTSDDKDEQYQLQALLCGTLQTAINHLEGEIAPLADSIMQLLLRVFSCRSATAHEEAFMAIGAMANAVEGGFGKYMTAFHPFLKHGLAQHEEHQVCVVAAGVVGDVVTLLIRNLQNPKLDRSVKPPILGVFGDIALAIGGNFEKYLPVAMTMLQQAGRIATPDPDDEDMVEYVSTLREGILDAYAGVIQGLHGDNKASLLQPYANLMGQFLGVVSMDENRDDDTTRAIAGVLGDMAQSLGPAVKLIVTHQFAQKVLNECKASDVDSTKEMGNWAISVIAEL